MITSQVLLKTIHVFATEQVNSTLEIDNSISADNDHQSGENLCQGTKETQSMSSCGGVAGADKPMQVGLSSQKSLRGLAVGSELGSGQHPEALRRICDFRIIFSVIFPTREKDMIGKIHRAFKVWKQLFKG